MLPLSAVLLALWTPLATAATQVPFSQYVLTPSSRVAHPVAIYQTGGNVDNAAAFLPSSSASPASTQSTTFAGNGSYVTVDFGRNIAGRVSFHAVDPLELMWADYILDDPRMTNSTFIERRAADGTPLYPVYDYDPRVSHAYGWSTAPTSMLAFYAGGLTMTSAVGRTWKAAPALGGLGGVQTGYETRLGSFATSWTNSSCGLSGTFTTPGSTTGELSIPLAVGSRRLVLQGPEKSKEIQPAGLSAKCDGFFWWDLHHHGDVNR